MITNCGMLPRFIYEYCFKIKIQISILMHQEQRFIFKVTLSFKKKRWKYVRYHLLKNYKIIVSTKIKRRCRCKLTLVFVDNSVAWDETFIQKRFMSSFQTKICYILSINNFCLQNRTVSIPWIGFHRFYLYNSISYLVVLRLFLMFLFSNKSKIFSKHLHSTNVDCLMPSVRRYRLFSVLSSYSIYRKTG